MSEHDTKSKNLTASEADTVVTYLEGVDDVSNVRSVVSQGDYSVRASFEAMGLRGEIEITDIDDGLRESLRVAVA